jgi:hypothetical protein
VNLGSVFERFLELRVLVIGLLPSRALPALRGRRDACRQCLPGPLLGVPRHDEPRLLRRPAADMGPPGGRGYRGVRRRDLYRGRA